MINTGFVKNKIRGNAKTRRFAGADVPGRAAAGWRGAVSQDPSRAGRAPVTSPRCHTAITTQVDFNATQVTPSIL